MKKYLIVVGLIVAALYFAYNWWIAASKSVIAEFRKNYPGVIAWAEAQSGGFVISKKSKGKWVIVFDVMPDAIEVDKYRKMYPSVEIKAA